MMKLIGFCAILAMSSLGCSTKPVRHRQPSSASEFLSESARRNFEVSLIPPEFRAEESLEISEIPVMRQACLKTDYGPWMKPVGNLQRLAERDAFLLAQLNRPFYFVVFPSEDSALRIVGRPEDLKEFLCVSLVAREGHFEENAGLEVSPELLIKILRQPRINSTVLDLVVQFWLGGPRDLRTGQAVLAHPLFNRFHLREMIAPLYRKGMATSDRIQIFAAILNSKALTPVASEMLSFIFNESSNFIDAQERYLMVKQVLDAATPYEFPKLLDFATRKVDVSKDYSPVFEKLSRGRRPEEQFKALAALLQAGALFSPAPTAAVNPTAPSAAEGYFLRLWEQNPPPALREAMAALALSDFGNGKWFSPKTIDRVAMETLQDSSPMKFVQSTLNLYQRSLKSPRTVREQIIKSAGTQAALDAPTAEMLINSATLLRSDDPTAEAALNSTVFAVAKQFRSSGAVFEAYVRYLKWMIDKKIQLAEVASLFPEPRLSSATLTDFATKAQGLSSDLWLSYVEKVLRQPQINAAGLENLMELASGHHPPTEVDKKLFTMILNHPQANLAIQRKAQRGMSGEFQNVEEKDPRH